MVDIVYSPEIQKQIKKKFSKSEAIKVVNFLETVKENPKKGKQVGLIGNTVIKELKYKSFRFYFITDYRQLKFLELEELQDLIVRFMRMSDKKNQQIIIDELKSSLISIEHIVSEK